MLYKLYVTVKSTAPIIIEISSIFSMLGERILIAKEA
jgi:hypothetical protein